MKQVGQVLTTNLKPASEEPAPRDFTREEIIEVNWFFWRASTVWANFTVTYPDDTTLRAAKREWAPDILRFSRAQLSAAFDHIKKNISDHPWFSPGNVLEYAQSYKAQALHRTYLPPPPPGPNARTAGREALDNMKLLFGENDNGNDHR